MAQYSELSHFIFNCKKIQNAVQIGLHFRLHFRISRKETEPVNHQLYFFHKTKKRLLKFSKREIFLKILADRSHAKIETGKKRAKPI
jgi:hypothetical protein